MTKKEQVLAVLAGEKPDRAPACFSVHFPRREAFGEAAVKAHLRFYRETGVDILKVMNENLVPFIGEYDGAAAWERVLPAGAERSFIEAQAELIRRLRQEEPDAYLLGTVHGVTAGLIHTLEPGYGYAPVRELLVRAFRSEPEALLAAAERVTDAMCELVRRAVAAGCDGIYYAALGGETRYFSDEEFNRLIRPLDLRILKEIRSSGAHVFLHICKDGLRMERYRDYGPFCDVVNWGVYEAPFSLEEGRRLFPKARILGGLPNHDGPLTSGSDPALVREVRRIAAYFGEEPFLLGADCTLPTDLPLQRIRTAIDALRG